MTTVEIGPDTDRFGPYLLRGLIGRGAMGEVHRAVDTAHDGRVVALKLLPPAVSGDPVLRERFRRESETVAGLGEPHVIPVHGYGEIDGRLYLDMLLVDGPDLAALLTTAGPMAAALAVAVVEQVASALDAAHAAGLVHHDVKPSNVLVHRPVPGQVPHVLLADFGIAGDAAGLGTVEYLAPERIRGLPGDRRVDVYALTCVLFELLTGARVFAGGELAAQLHGHLHRPPPRPSQLVAGSPAGLDEVVARGLAKDPDHRYPRAGELAAHARTAITPVRGRVSRRGALLGAAAGLLAFSGGLGATAALRSGGGSGAALAAPAPDSPPTEPAAAGGPGPEPVVTERALGVRTIERDPFPIVAIGGTALALVPIDGAFQGWDLLADTAVGLPLPGGSGLDGIATTSQETALVEVDGVPLLCCAPPGESSVEFRDLRTGQPVGAPLVLAGALIHVLRTARVDGAPVLVAMDTDRVLTHHDLRTRVPLGPPRPRPQISTSDPFRVVSLGGRDRLFVNDFSGTSSCAMLDAGTFEEIASWPGSLGLVAELDGVAVQISAPVGPLPLQVRDLATGEELRSIPGPVRIPDPRHWTASAAAELDGRLLVAWGTRTGEIVLYDIGAGTAIGSPMRGHEAAISSLAVVAVGDRPVLVSTSLDNSIRVWDVAVRAHG